MRAPSKPDEFLSQVYDYLNALTLSGTTAQRPTTFLYTGRTYFDATLGYAIWWNGAIWVNSAGLPA